MSYRPQIKKSDGTMQDLPLDAETIKGQEVKGLAFKDTIKNDDIANDAAIAQSKVSGLSTSLSAKIDKSGGELKDTVVTFDDVSGMAANIESGETAKTLFGKIKNWFGRLKTLAFKDTIKNADIAGDADIAQHKIDGLRTDYVASLSVSGKTVTYKNKNGVRLGTITTQDTTYSNATTVYDGLMSSEDKTKLNGIDSNANNYTLPQATRAALGGVKIGYTKNGDNYPVQLSSSGQMFVTVSGGGGGSESPHVEATISVPYDVDFGERRVATINDCTLYSDRVEGHISFNVLPNNTFADIVQIINTFLNADNLVVNYANNQTSIFGMFIGAEPTYTGVDIIISGDTGESLFYIDWGTISANYIELKSCTIATSGDSYPTTVFVNDATGAYLGVVWVNPQTAVTLSDSNYLTADFVVKFNTVRPD